VSDENVRFLNAGCAGRGDEKGDIGFLGELAPIHSGEGYSFHSHLFCRFNGPDHIGRVSAGAETDRNIPFLAEGLQLFREDFVKGKVVGDAGENGGIRRQSDGREGRALHQISVDEFCSEMLSICCASPIPEEKKFIPFLKGLNNEFDRVDQFGEILFKKTVLDF
jgi:hypothetical protein